MGLLIVRGGALLSFFLVFTIPSPSLTLLLFESTFFHMPVLYVPWGLGGGGGGGNSYIKAVLLGATRWLTGLEVKNRILFGIEVPKTAGCTDH